MLATIANHTNTTTASLLSSISSSLAKSVPRPDTLIGVDDLIRKEFAEYRGSCFGWLLKATALVVVGLGFEGSELCHEIPAIIRPWLFRRRFHFSLPEYHPPNWTKVLASIGWFFIVVGVAGEYVADSFFSTADGYVQTFDETLIGDAGKSAKSALKQIADLKIEQAGYREQANAAYLQSYLQLGKTAVSLGPRSQLLEDKKDEFIKALRPFSPQRIILVSCGLKGDAELEANALERALFAYFGREAGWAVEEYQGRPATEWDCEAATRGDPVTIPGGIMLVLSNNWTERHSAVVAAQKLEQTLNKLNITTRIAADTKLDNAAILADGGTFWKNADATLSDDPKAIFLLVGPNPLVSFTEPKKRPK